MDSLSVPTTICIITQRDLVLVIILKKKTSLEASNLAVLLELKFPVVGTIQTMNFAINGRHLADQDYTICMRQEEGKNDHCKSYQLWKQEAFKQFCLGKIEH